MLASISGRTRGKSSAAEALTEEYVRRTARAAGAGGAEAVVFDTEAALLAAAERASGAAGGRAAAVLLLFDSRGELLTSEGFADVLGRLRDGGAQRVMLGVGPADGWSAAALERAQRRISLGKMTLPHELARVVVAEQMYRAFCILAGHPYHGGH